MRPVTSSLGPIRSQTPNRAGYRDTAAPYPSQSGCVTRQTRHRASGPSGVLISPTSSQLSSPGFGDENLSSLSRNSTPTFVSNLDAPTACTSDPSPLFKGLLNAPSPTPSPKTILQLDTSDGPVIPTTLLDVDYNLDGLDQTFKFQWHGYRSYEDEAGPDLIESPLARSYSRETTHDQSGIPGPSSIAESGPEAPPRASTPLKRFASDAPTTAEYTINRLEENRDIMKAKRLRGEPYKRIKGVRSITGYTDQEQQYMLLMRVVMFYVWVTHIPWAIEDRIVVDHAKTYLKKNTEINLEEVVTNDFIRTLCSGTSRLRGEGQNRVLTQVKHFWSLEGEDVVNIEYLQEKDRFLYLDRNKESDKHFNTELIGNVMATLMFGTTKKIGILFLDKMMEVDDPEELDRVLRFVAKSGPDDKPQIPTIVDSSPQARRGPSISAIAFTCIHIYHALERLKFPANRGRKGRSKSGDFGARGLEARWARYVRELTQRPELGEIRASLLKRMQAEYVKLRPREEQQPLGTDFMW